MVNLLEFLGRFLLLIHTNNMSSSPEIMPILTQLMDNQNEIKTDLFDLKERMLTLEKGSLSMSYVAANKLYNQIENELIDL